MTAEQIIVALGDTAVVAELLGLNLPVVSNWKLRGIPPSRWLDIHELAVAGGRPDITAEVIRGAIGRRDANPAEAA